MIRFIRSSNLLRGGGGSICSKSISSTAAASKSTASPMCVRRSLHVASLGTFNSYPLISDREVVRAQISSTLTTISTARRFIHHHADTSMSKVCPDAKTALQLSGLKSGDTIAVGGFGNGGIPETILNALSSQEDGPSNLTVASLTAGVDSFGLGRLFEAGKVKRMISSYVGENKVSNVHC